jgi:hypothetical protein
MIATEVAKIEDPMQRVKVATDLFGRSGAEILPTLIADVQKLGDAAPVMSEKATQAFDAVGDGMSSAWTWSKTLVGEGIAGLIDGFSRLGSAANALAHADLDGVTDALMELNTELPKAAAHTSIVAEAGKALALSEKDAARAIAEMDAVIKEANKSQAAGAKLAKEMADNITEAAETQLEALIHFRQQNELDELQGTDRKLKRIEFERDAAIDAAGREYAANKELYAAMMVEIDTFYNHKREMVEGSATDILAALAAERDASMMAADAMVADTNRIIAAKDAEVAAIRRARMAQGSTFEYDLSTNFGRAQIERMNTGITEFLRQGYSIQQAMQLLMGRRYGFPVDVGEPDLPPWPPGFASGVRNFSGGWAMVGERGPEMFVPSTGGRIIPNGGGGNLTITVPLYLDGKVVAQAVVKQDRLTNGKMWDR